MESRLGTLLLQAIDGFESHHGRGPTVPELAADLGITPDFGHAQLVKLLQRELATGCVAYLRGRVELTGAGRSQLEGHVEAGARQSVQARS